jgi:Cft2 family RNA processing exonuclease
MADVSFVSLGSADSIGASCHVLKFPNFSVAVDRGAGFKEGEREPLVEGNINAVLVTHGHLDHVGMLPRVSRHWPKARIWATYETSQIARWIWDDQIFISSQEHRSAPFSEEEVELTVRRMRRMVPGQSIRLSEEVTVTPVHAGHILGAVMLVFSFRGASYVVTGDMCLRDHSFIRGADLPDAPNCRLLVRESTYAGQWPTQTRDQVKEELVAFVRERLECGGKVIIPALSIDRLPEIYDTLHTAGIDRTWPVWVAGGARPMEIYRDNLSGARPILNTVMRFEGIRHRLGAMRSRQPMVILASSGMMMRNTPSYDWAVSILEDSNSGICQVNWADPCSPAGIIAASEWGQEVDFPGGSYKRMCQVRQFRLSTHAQEDEMQELEEHLRPDLIVHVHGDGERTKKFIDDTRDKGPQRIGAKVAVEIPV